MHHQLLNLDPRGGAHRIVVRGVSLEAARQAVEKVVRDNFDGPSGILKVIEKRGYLHILFRLWRLGRQRHYGRAKLKTAKYIVEEANSILCEK